MARGVDSSRDPRRNLSRDQIARIAAQRQRARFLAGDESRFPVDAELRVGRRGTEEQRNSEIYAMQLENDALVEAIMQPELGRQEHNQREATPHSSAPEPQYGMTKAEWDVRQAGGKWPTGWPSSVDPFPFSQSASTETAEQALWKKGSTANHEGDGDTSEETSK